MNSLENRGPTSNGLMTYEIYRTIQEIAAYSNKIDPEYVKILYSHTHYVYHTLDS